MKNKLIAFTLLLVLTGCAEHTYMEDQADECRSKGGEPTQIYTSNAHGLIMGCHFE